LLLNAVLLCAELLGTGGRRCRSISPARWARTVANPPHDIGVLNYSSAPVKIMNN